MNQTREILKYIADHPEGITSYEAFTKFGCTRLADVVWRLRQQGYKIESVPNLHTNRYGSHVSIARYRLEDEE